MITSTAKEHKEALRGILVNSGQFDEESIAHIMGDLDNYFEHPDHEIWLTALADENNPVGFAYCAPEPVTLGTWNLLMIWVKSDYEGQGYGRSLVSAIEHELKDKQARLLIVETSQLPEFEAARAFYTKQGFTFAAEIQDFFAEGDHKLVYTKPVTSP